MTDITENPGALKAMVEQLLDTIADQQKSIEYLEQECLVLEEAYHGALTVIDEMEAERIAIAKINDAGRTKARHRIKELEAQLDPSQKTH